MNMITLRVMEFLSTGEREYKISGPEKADERDYSSRSVTASTPDDLAKKIVEVGIKFFEGEYEYPQRRVYITENGIEVLRGLNPEEELLIAQGIEKYKKQSEE